MNIESKETRIEILKKQIKTLKEHHPKRIQSFEQQILKLKQEIQILKQTD